MECSCDGSCNRLGVVALFVVRAWRLASVATREELLRGPFCASVSPRFNPDAKQGGVELREVQEDIAVAETFFSIGGTQGGRGLKAWWNGRTDRVV